MEVVVAIVVKDQKILVGELKPEKLEDFGGLKYVFPGGKIERDERADEAAVRETLEETGYEVKVIQKIGERVHPKTGKLMHYVHCELVGGEGSVDSPLNNDLARLIWAKREELETYMPTLFPVVADYLVNP